MFDQKDNDEKLIETLTLRMNNISGYPMVILKYIMDFEI